MPAQSRRKFLKTGLSLAPVLAIPIKGKVIMKQIQPNPIHLGGPLFADYDDPLDWVKAHRRWGYSAAYCPLDADASDEQIRAFKKQAQKNGLIIAEVGAWSNPINPDDGERQKAINYCVQQLTLADRIAARCCVNIAGTRSPDPDNRPHKDNLTAETFDLIVETTRHIINQVKPTRTFFCLETMPWIFPNSVDSYVQLLKKIDHPRFAVHFDPVNIINSPDRYFSNTSLLQEAFEKLGPYIKSCHAKDTIIKSELTTHISEIQPGLGNLDYPTYLRELSRLGDVPLMLEHMETPGEYRAAGKYIRSVARDCRLEVAVI